MSRDPSEIDSTSKPRDCITSPKGQSLTTRDSFSYPGQLVAKFRKKSRRNIGCNIGSPTTEQQSVKHAMQEEIVPLSGKPYFSCIISKSQFYSDRLVVPRWSYRFLPCSTVPVVLSYRSRTWQVRYCGTQNFKRFNCGWRNFMVENNINIGDGCIFELMDRKKMLFRVQVFHGEVPALATNGGDGQSSESPILID